MNKLLPLGIGMLLCLASTVSMIAQGEQDPLAELAKLECGSFRIDPCLRAAAKLQALGKDKALASLREAAKKRDRNFAVIVLCRILFTKKDDGEFRRPLIGGAFFFGGTSYSDWPLEPIALIDNTPFMVTRSYIIAGLPDALRRKKECPFSRRRLFLTGGNAGILQPAAKPPNRFRQFGVCSIPKPAAVQVGTQLANSRHQLARSHLGSHFRQRPKGLK